VPVAQGADAGLDDRFGGGKVRLAHFHVHDVAPGGRGGLGATHDLHHVERGDVRHAGGGSEAVGHAATSRSAGQAASYAARRSERSVAVDRLGGPLPHRFATRAPLPLPQFAAEALRL
jgi:hypothetical protein